MTEQEHIESAMEALGHLRKEHLLYLAAQDWVRNIRLARALQAVLDREDGSQGSTPLRDVSTKVKDELLAASKDESFAAAKKKMATEGARARHAKDQKQKDKKVVHQRWQQWQAGEVAHTSVAAFARSIFNDPKLTLKSKENIGKWCRDWVKGKGIPH